MARQHFPPEFEVKTPVGRAKVSSIVARKYNEDPTQFYDALRAYWEIYGRPSEEIIQAMLTACVYFKGIE